MVKRVDPEYLSGPIAGMSLTAEPGSRPWENPPMFPTVEGAIAFYTEQILDPDTEDYIVSVLTKDISVEAAANQIISSGAMNGIHTIDVGFLIDPVIRELIMYVADMAGIDYVESYEKRDKEQRIPRALAMQIVDEIFGETVEEAPEPAPEAPGGLMARRPSPPPMESPVGAPMAPEGMAGGAGMMAPTGGAPMPPELAAITGGQV